MIPQLNSNWQSRDGGSDYSRGGADYGENTIIGGNATGIGTLNVQDQTLSSRYADSIMDISVMAKSYFQ